MPLVHANLCLSKQSICCTGRVQCNAKRPAQDVLDRTRVKKSGIHAFVELHIEQGPVLEKAREELGLVTAIAAVRGPPRGASCLLCLAILSEKRLGSAGSDLSTSTHNT